MKQLTLTLIIGFLIFTGCEDKNSSNESQAQGEEVTTHDIDAAGASGFYYDFSSGAEVDSSSSWHISFQMIPVAFGQSIYMMPSLVLGGNIYAADGSILATSVPRYEIRWDAAVPSKARFQQDKVALAGALATFLNQPQADIQKHLEHARKKKNRYWLVAKNLSFS